jgi:branched-chain amino acid aminotransferase
VEERPFALYDVWSADEVIMSGTAIEVQAVVDVDGRTIGDGTIGPIARSLIDAYAAYVRSHGTPIWRDDVGETPQDPFVEVTARR